MLRRVRCVTLAGLFLVEACTWSKSDRAKDASSQSAKPGPDLVLAPSQYLRLQSFPSCASTDRYMRENIRQLLKESFDQQRHALEHWKDMMASQSRTMGNEEMADEASGSASGPEDFSRTNTQVEGVDEPDLVKTDGKTIYSISGSNIQITASWPVESLQKVATIPIKGQPLGLLLTEDNKLIVIYHPSYQPPTGEEDRSMPYPGISYPWSTSYGHHHAVRVAIYDVAQAVQPQLVREQTFWGSYLNLRRQGNIIRLVQTLYEVPFPEGIETYIDTSAHNAAANSYQPYIPISLEEFDRRRAALEQKNETLLASYSLKGALKVMMQETGFSTDDPFLADTFDCTAIYASQRLGQLGFTTVTSLNIQDGQVSQAAVLAPANQLYASEGSLYLAHTMRAWWWGWSTPETSKTYIHKFKYESPDSVKIAYQGSGVVDGYILNQFALDEYQDVLRVAVTVEARTPSSPEPLSRDTAASSPMGGGGGVLGVNRVVTLAAGAEGLEELGRTPDLAPGEQIYSVRFAGDKGYVVTFRQVDPLYTLDLRDPKAPKVVGELKITGYSSYIHMIDDVHLLTVGDEVDPHSLRRMGLKISLFDVSDPAKPSEKFKYIASDAYSSSEALYDHHAFNWFASRKLLAIPVSGYRQSPAGSNWWDKYFAELQVFSIDFEKGIEPRGAVAVGDLYQGKTIEWYEWQWVAQPRRSVFADDYIYAISTFGIGVVHRQELSKGLKAARFYP